MTTPRKNILLTGLPGCGKTTLVRRVVERLGDLRLAGFVTQELRAADGRRVGFEAIGLSGSRATLADVGSKSQIRVGRYGVELQEFEKLIDVELSGDADVDLFVVDEIGKKLPFYAAVTSRPEFLLELPFLSRLYRQVSDNAQASRVE